MSLGLDMFVIEQNEKITTLSIFVSASFAPKWLQLLILEHYSEIPII